jgi:hypothetical protein
MRQFLLQGGYARVKQLCSSPIFLLESIFYPVGPADIRQAGQISDATSQAHSRRFALMAFEVAVSAATSSSQTLSTSCHILCYQSSTRLYTPTRDVHTSRVASSGGRYPLIPAVLSLVWMLPKLVAKCCRFLAISRLSAGYFANSS